MDVIQGLSSAHWAGCSQCAVMKNKLQFALHTKQLNTHRLTPFRETTTVYSNGKVKKRKK
jgi:hypothetical protein